jgi:hypothetical protein
VEDARVISIADIEIRAAAGRDVGVRLSPTDRKLGLWLLRQSRHLFSFARGESFIIRGNT